MAFLGCSPTTFRSLFRQNSKFWRYFQNPESFFQQSAFPWINNELVSLMRKRDYLKKKATKDKSCEAWDQFKQARNQTNNAIREAKRQYFSKNLEEHKTNPRKTWSLINELSSRQRKSTTVSDVKVEGKLVTSSKDVTCFQLSLYFYRRETGC